MTFDEYRQYVSELAKVPVHRIKDEATFREDLGVDSLQMVNLIVGLTERFGADPGNLSSMADMDTVGKMYRCLNGGD